MSPKKRKGPKGKNKTTKYTPILAGIKFNECWGATMKATYEEAALKSAQDIGQSSNHPRFHLLVNFAREKIPALFSIRKQFQKHIFDALCDVLDERGELMDLFSGDATATLPLLACGKVNGLALVDNGKSPTCKAHAELVAGRMKISDRVQHLNVSIDSNTPEDALPTTQEVVLADSGIALPTQYRFPPKGQLRQNEMQYPPAYRSSHVNESRATIDDVLRSLGNVPRRRLHVFDTPFYRHDIKPEVSRDYVQGFVDLHPEWNIESWGEVKVGVPMIYGVLKHE